MATILVVDDRPINRQFLVTLLSYAGHTIVEAGDGLEALASMRASRPGLVIADIYMPNMDGFQMAKEMKADPALAAIPIFFYTATYRVRDAAPMAASLGITTVLPKPSEPVLILQTVARALGLEETLIPPPPAPLMVSQAVAQKSAAAMGLKLSGYLFGIQELNLKMAAAIDDGLALVAEREQLEASAAELRASLITLQTIALRLSAVVEAGLEMASEREPKALLDLFCRAAQDVISARYVAVGILDAAGDSIETLFARGFSAEELGRFGARRGELGRVLSQRRASRLAGLDGSIEPAGLPAGHPPIQSFLGVPIASPGRVYGWLYLADRLGAPEFNEDDERIAATLAAQLALCYENATLYEDLRKARERMDHIMASSPAVTYVLRHEGEGLPPVPTWVSANIQGLIGQSPDEVLHPAWWYEHVDPEDLRGLLADVPRFLKEGSATREYRIRHADGSWRWVHDDQLLVSSGHGGPTEVIGSWSDVTARKEAEARLAESEAQYRLLFERNPQPTWVFDPETLRFLAVNGAAVARYGYTREEFLDMTVRDIRPQDEVPALLDRIASREASREDTELSSGRIWRHHSKDGRLLEVESAWTAIDYGGRRACLVLINDVTEKRALEAQFLQAQKMESVGRLAGGVAHDFNNILGVIVGYGQLLAKQATEESKQARYTAAILEAAERATGLTRQLLAFSRQELVQPKSVDLNAAVTAAEKMLRRLLGEDLEVRVTLAENLGRVKADPNQIDQILMNLAVNARDAMPKGGFLTIETADVELDAAYARRHADVEPGPYVMLAVSDTGSGMSPQVQAHIFEPFFTTKEKGKGTGLGLGTVYGIVKQSGGHIWVYSEPGHGTSFKIYLPRLTGAGEAIEAPKAIGPLPRGTETVLLVEDEAALRGVVTELLQSLGYTVLGAPNASQAMALVDRGEQPLHIVVTDVVLPGVSGRELGERVTAARPNTKLLYVSGYTDDAVTRYGIKAGEMEFLQKPFTSEMLAQKVRAVLDGA